MGLDRLQRHWTAFGEQDPLWAILTTPGKRGGAWDLDEFFATGPPEVEEVLQVLADRAIAIEHGRALDFGCGVGRLTRALAEQFDSCDGVDVAASMVERARELNANGERVRFHHNDAPDLGLFGDGTFDFILALIVLQHMEPELMRGYMREFIRVLRPGAVAFFNVPERYLIGDELPPDGWRASVTLIGAVPELAPGQISPLRFGVRNESPVSWPASAQLRVGDHWLAADGTPVVFDDARAMIQGLEPGEICEVQLDVVAPGRPGRYQLEIDLVQEWIAWFADRGSTTLKMPVDVAAVPDAPVDGEAGAAETQQATNGQCDLTPTMEMHVMARPDVVATVEEAGGVVLEAMARDRCGASIPSVDYVVARAVSPVRRPPPAASETSDPLRARIRATIEAGRTALRERTTRPSPPDPGRRGRARQAMDERLDLVDSA